MNRSYRWLWRTAVCVGVLSLLLQACSGSTPPSGSSAGPSVAEPSAPGATAAASQAPVTITMWVPPWFQNITGHEAESKNEGDYWDYLAGAYEALHPNITVDVTHVGWADIDTKTTVAMASGTQPDVIFDYGPRLYKGFATGGFEAVDGIYSTEDAKDFVAGPWNFSFDPNTGKQFMIPLVGHVEGLIGVVEDFWADQSKLDLLPPNGGTWTFDQFEAAVNAVAPTLPAGTYVMCLETADEQGMNQVNMNKADGGLVFTTDDKNVGDDTSKAKYEAVLARITDWYKKGWMTPDPQALAGGECNPVYQQKQVAVFMSPRESLIKAGLDAGTLGPFKVRWVAVPTSAGAKPKVFVAASGFAIGKQTDPAKRTEAQQFVAWLTSPENMKAYVSSDGPSQGGATYSRISIGTDGYPKTSTLLEPVLQLLANPDVEQVSNGLGYFSPAFQATRNCEFPEWQAAFNGSKTPTVATDAFWACSAAAIANAAP